MSKTHVPDRIIRAAGTALLVLAATITTTPAAAEPKALAKCQSLNDQIERYTAQRRKGGSASQMQRWKEQLRAAEGKFRELGCSEFRRELR